MHQVPVATVEVECIYRRREEDVILFNLLHTDCQHSDDPVKERLHMRPGDDSTSSSSQASQGVFDHQAPLVGLVSQSQSQVLKIYSLKSEKTVHVLRFCSPIAKFQAKLSCSSPQMIVLL